MSIESKKNKKKAAHKRSRKLFEMLEQIRHVQQEQERIHGDDAREKKRNPSEGVADEQIWSEKVATIRNRLTNQKRTSKERWNRFAGTGDEGGRGL